MIDRLQEILDVLNDGDSRGARYMLQRLIEDECAEIDKIAQHIDMIDPAEYWKGDNE